MTLIGLAVALGLGVLSSHLEWIRLASSAVTPENTEGVATRCKGDNLVLSEPRSGVAAHHVFVFRNGESVASTSVPATGELKDRLLVNADSAVILTNLSFSDHGLYRVDVKISDDKTTKHKIRLVIGEPPETVDGKLLIMADSSNDTVVRLMCGTFTSLGYPPVSTIWKDPTNQLLASTGFTGQYFTLDLPVEVAKSGPYCCQLDCRGPSKCCLDDQSPLRQCATIDLPIGSTKDRVTTDESVSVRNFINVVRELDKTHQRDNFKRGVTAIYYRVEGEAPRDQQDVCTDKATNFSREASDVHKTEEDIKYLYNLNKTMEEICSQIQDSIETVNKSINTHCLKIDRQAGRLEVLSEAVSEQQQRTEAWMSSMSDELNEIKSSLTAAFEIQMKEEFINYVYNMSQTVENFQTQNRHDMTSVNDSVNTHSLELKKHSERVEAAVTEQQRKTETWTSTTTDQLNYLQSNLSTVAQLLAAIETKTDTRISEIRNKVIGIENFLLVLEGKTVESYQTVQLSLSSLMRARCLDKGYTMHEGRCWKFYSRKYDYAQAESVCRENTGHLVHLKSRAQDALPFLSFLAKNGKHVNDQWGNCLWVGADDIATEGAFVWTDGTLLPTDSDLWLTSQPDDYKKSEDCVQACKFSSLSFNDYPCSGILDFVCQIDL